MDALLSVDVGAIVIAALSLAGVVYNSWRTAAVSARNAERAAEVEARAAEIEEKKVDAEAYDRAQEILNRTIDLLRAEVMRLKDELDDTRRKLEIEKRLNDGYALRVCRLEHTIREAGLPVPNGDHA